MVKVDGFPHHHRFQLLLTWHVALKIFSGADLKKTGKLATYFLMLTGVYSVQSLYTDCCVAMDQGSRLQLQMRKLCCFVTLLSRKKLKILLLAFIITVIRWVMCWHNAAARKAAENLNILFQIIFQKHDLFRGVFRALLLKSACEGLARCVVMKDGRKSLLMILSYHHQDRED